jgi:hypothetical protein
MFAHQRAKDEAIAGRQLLQFIPAAQTHPFLLYLRQVVTTSLLPHFIHLAIFSLHFNQSAPLQWLPNALAHLELALGRSSAFEFEETLLEAFCPRGGTGHLFQRNFPPGVLLFNHLAVDVGEGIVGGCDWVRR